MNQSVRPLPFAAISEPAAVECALPGSPQGAGATPDEAAANFDELLDSEIQDDGATGDVEEPKLADAWTLYTFGSTPVQILAEIPSIPVSGSTETATVEQGNETDSSEMPGIHLAKSAQATSDASLERPTQQNVPLPVVPTASPPQNSEQIAPKRLETTKNARGIPVAQEPSMLRTSEKQEKSAEKQSFSFSAEKSEAVSLDTTVAVRAANQFRDSAPKRDQEFNNFTAAESIQPEWSSFDGISEAVEIQAPKQVESTEVLQAIRSHVELLKTSNQQKLDVVLRPDGHTEIRLHVEKVNGEILLQARCERGDFVRLESNWSAIQQSLANQGVRVEPLQQSAAFHQNEQNFSGSFASSDRESNAQQERETKIFEQEIPSITRPKKSVAHSSSARGWQSWA